MELRHPLIVIGLFALLAACNRSEPQHEPSPQDHGAMQQSQNQTDQYRSAASATTEGDLASNSDSQQSTRASGGGAAQEPSKLLAATADASYELTMEQLAGERDTAMKQCDGMTMEQAKSCRDRAAAAFERALAQAENARDARTPADSE